MVCKKIAASNRRVHGRRAELSLNMFRLLSKKVGVGIVERSRRTYYKMAAAKDFSFVRI